MLHFLLESGFVLSAVAAVTLAAAASQALAVETATSSTVMVTASRVEQELLDVPMAVTVVGKEEIKESTARTIGEMLEDVPGVQVNNDGSQGLKRLSIRGEDSFRTLVLIDGQKVSEQKSMSGSAILIDPSAVERIEVIKGPASVLYGSDAIGGAVNIITKKGGKKAVEGDVSVGWNGAGHGWSESATVQGSYKGFHYRFNANNQSQDELDTPWGRLPHTSFRQKSAGAFMSYDLTDKVTVGMNYDWFNLKAGSGSVTYSPEDFFVDIPRWRKEKVGVFAEAKNISDYLTRLRWDGFWQKNQKIMENYVNSDEDGARVTVDNKANNKLRTVGTSLQADWQIGGKNMLITGYEYTEDRLVANTSMGMDMNVSAAMGSVMSMNMARSYVTDRYNKGNLKTHALFANMESQLPHDLTATYGVRWTHVTTDMEDAVADKNGGGKMVIYRSMRGMKIPISTTPYSWVHQNDGSAGETGSHTNSKAVFNAGLVWRGLDDWALRATWSQGFRVPLMQEKYLFTSMGSTSGGTYGNPDLKPETSNNFELGARYAGGNINADVAAFLSRARNYITTEAMADGVNYQYMNADKANTYGLEFSINAKVCEHFTPYATLTLMRRHIETGNYKTYDAGVPQAYARYGVRANYDVLGGKLKGDVYLRSQSETKYMQSDDESASGYSTARVGGFTTFNAAASYDFAKLGVNWRLGVEFLNIFDKKYQYNTSTYEPGRHFNLKLTGSF